MLIRVAEIGELPPEKGKVFLCEDNPIAVFNVDGEVVAMDNRCPHRGGSLGDGDVSYGVVTCPWHHWQIRCETGEVVANPTIKQKMYPIIKTSDGYYVEKNKY